MSGANVKSRLIGRHEIERKIGGGGLGKVYLAYDTVLRRKVIVKVCDPIKAIEGSEHKISDIKRRFLNMGKIFLETQHTNLLPTLDADIHADYPFIVNPIPPRNLMRAIGDAPSKGEVLRKWHYQSVCRFAVEICSAVHAAHRNGILHRDISSRCIFLGKNSRAFVSDFGCSIFKDGKRISFLNDRAPRDYVSPEIKWGISDGSARSDIFSIGCLLFRLLTGQTPSGKESSVYEYDRDISVPKEMNALIMACLNRNPGRRPSCTMFLEAEFNKIMKLDSVAKEDAPEPQTKPGDTTLEITRSALPDYSVDNIKASDLMEGSDQYGDQFKLEVKVAQDATPKKTSNLMEGSDQYMAKDLVGDEDDKESDTRDKPGIKGFFTHGYHNNEDEDF